jgi:hypothetical protein
VIKLVLAILLMLISCSVSMAGPHKSAKRPGYGAVITYQGLAPEAAALKAAQQYWPNVPLCDDGGYRIRPCSLAGG